jgi:hypothetical protein
MIGALKIRNQMRYLEFSWTEYSVNFISEALLRVAVLSGISQCLNLEPEPEITSQTMVPELSQKTD